MPDVFSGDVKLFLTRDGSDILLNGGQPVMEQGIENLLLISLFTRRGWVGNIFHADENQIGSGFEDACDEGVVTLELLKLIANAAERALSSPEIGKTTVSVVNAHSNDVTVTIQTTHGNLAVSRINDLWQNQRSQ
jgi:hypothetical protein